MMMTDDDDDDDNDDDDFVGSVDRGTVWSGPPPGHYRHCLRGSGTPVPEVTGNSEHQAARHNGGRGHVRDVSSLDSR